jgi:arylformamidase
MARAGDGRTRVDLSHAVRDGMITYKGLPAPVICDFLSRGESESHYAEGTTFQIGQITMCANTGTYVDSPFHRYEDGADLAALPLEHLAELDGVVVDATGDGRAVEPDRLRNYQLHRKAVLIRTDWDRNWGSESYFEGHPFLTRKAASYLVEQEALLVGIDSLNIDDTGDGTRPAHTLLLGSDIPICEHMTGLRNLPPDGFRFSAVPVKVEGMGTFPVRAFATF